MKLHVDNKAFARKPEGVEIGGIKARFTKPGSIQDLTPAQIIAAIKAGYTIQPGVTPFSATSKAAGNKGTVDADFTEQTLFEIDIDNKRGDVPRETPAHVAEVLLSNNIDIAFMYYSFSSTEELEKFRVGIICYETVTDRAERDKIQAALIQAFPQADTDCINADRIYFAGKEFINSYSAGYDTDKEMLIAFADKILGVSGYIEPLTGKSGGTIKPDAVSVINNNEGTPPPTVPADINRHGILTAYALTCLNRYKGDGDGRAYNDFQDKVREVLTLKPDTPDNVLDEREVANIWTSAVKKYQQNPDYFTTETASQEFDEIRQLDKIKCKFDALYVGATYLPYAGAKYSERKTCRLSEYKGETDLIIKIDVLPVEENMILLLRHYGLTFKFNIIKQSPEVWKQGEKQGQLQYYYSLIRDLCDKQGLKLPVNKFDDMLLSIARKTRYNPFSDWLNECGGKYDGSDYIGAVCNTIKSTLPDSVKRKYITKFLLQLAYIATSDDADDIAQHFLLVLKGKQGDGKSAWLMRLLPEWAQRENYGLPGRTCDVNNKDHILEQASALLVEWAEIAATFRKSDTEAIKAHITKKFDRLRPPYFKEAIDIKRRSCLCATVNDEEFLRDNTGDRRYTVIPCLDIDYQHNVDISGLWGQIWQMKQQGVPYWYSKEEITEVLAGNAEHRVKTELQVALENLFDLYPEKEPERYLYAKDIIEEINGAKVYGVHATPKSITQTLNALGVKSRLNKRVAMFAITTWGTAPPLPPPLGRNDFITDNDEDFLK
jgi:hypothetical protein